MEVIWVDIETTGLDPKKGHILEVAAIYNPNVLPKEGELWGNTFVYQINDPGWYLSLEEAPEVVQEMHRNTGLLHDINLFGVSPGQFEDTFQEWFNSLKLKEQPIMAGSSIHFDKAWLAEHYPRIERLFNYRILDVSSIKNVMKIWYPETAEKWDADHPKENAPHRALDDTRLSMKELNFYLHHLNANSSD